MHSEQLKNCKSYSDAINHEMFELRVPEYYEPKLSEYFKGPRTGTRPIVNGEFVEWSEFKEKHPDQELIEPNQSFTPDPIYKGEPLNDCVTVGSVMSIVDYLENDVPFNFVDIKDVQTVLDIIDGYKYETREFFMYSDALRRTFSRLDLAVKKLERINDAANTLLERTGQRRPERSFADFFSLFFGG